MGVTADRMRFEALFTAHYASLMRYAARRVGIEAAQEVVSETFLLAWRRLDDVPDNALPWLYGAARRVVANEVRRRSRASRLDERVAAWSTAPDADQSDIVSDQLRVRAALNGLSERDREVLMLANWEQLSGSEIATALGCSVAAAKVRLHRARHRFADLLGPEHPDLEIESVIIPGGSV
jgi:RNA polymerase sigma-70 factor, ECF subfamily